MEKSFGKPIGFLTDYQHSSINKMRFTELNKRHERFERPEQSLQAFGRAIE